MIIINCVLIRDINNLLVRILYWSRVSESNFLIPLKMIKATAEEIRKNGYEKQILLKGGFDHPHMLELSLKLE